MFHFSTWPHKTRNKVEFSSHDYINQDINNLHIVELPGQFDKETMSI